MDVRQLCEKMSAGPQLQPGEMADLAAAGFRSVINNRPDGEEPGQPTSAEMAAAARDAGLEYRHIPVVPGQLTPEAVAAFETALDELPGPVFSFCRTGTRASMLWALARCGELGADEVVGRAGQCGFDIAALAPRLAARAG